MNSPRPYSDPPTLPTLTPVVAAPPHELLAHRSRKPLLIAVGAAAVLVVVVAAVLMVGSRSFDVNGSMTLQDAYGTGSTMGRGESPCRGGVGYGDIGPGTSVTVRDEAGTTVATGRLDDGKADGESCVFPFSIADVPSGSKFYEVEVSHRGGVTFSRDELDERGASISLGS
jgi:hypothetical protein